MTIIILYCYYCNFILYIYTYIGMQISPYTLTATRFGKNATDVKNVSDK